MNDLHDAFAQWLLGGARDELPRDVALHASACAACLRAAAAVDALGAVDPGAAEPPPLRVAPGPVPSRRGPLAAVLGSSAVLAVIAAGIIAGSTLFRGPQTQPESAAATPTPGGAVLGGQGGPSVTPADSPSERTSPSPSASPSAVESAQPTEFAGPDGPDPTMGGGPPPVIPGTPPATAPPTPRATAPPPPPPTATPTPRPTPIPTPAPTPVPTPEPQCSDGIDNDGDGFIDFGLDPLVNDPACLSPGDNDEFLP